MSTPNDAAKTGQTKDAQDPAGTCPMKKDRIQLIPVRFGLVETLNAQEHTELPFVTQSKPLGIRLLRDGYIYVVVDTDSSWTLHEYQVERGVVTQLLWQGAEVISDQRTNSVGAANLVYERSKILYCAFSEIQWTARKCSQVIGSEKDRIRFMQSVNLCSFDATNGGKNLLTPKQASLVIAECAEHDSDVDGEYEYKPYEWEHKPLYKKLELSGLSSSVQPDYQEDYLYLVLNDDIGVLRDLATYQGLVAESLENWQSNEKQYQRYVEGCYIETQLQISPEKIDSLALMFGDESFVSELSEAQKEAVVAWIKEYDEKYDDFVRPSVGDKYQLMEKALGRQQMEKYEDLIHDIQEQFRNDLQGVPSWKIWNGNHGKLGIKDLIVQEEMEKFLEKERGKLAYWSRLLNVISEDRVNLFERFYTAAWYFDPTTNHQLEEFLAAEYSCIQDMCWNDEASRLVAEKLEEIPWVATYRAMFTLSVDEYDKLAEAIAKKISEVRLIATYEQNIVGINNIGTELNAIVAEKLAFLETIQANNGLSSYSQLIDSAFIPANTIGLTDTIDEFFQKVENVQTFSPSEVLRNFSGAAWLGVLQTYKNSDITLGFASEHEMRQFNALRENAEGLRRQNVSLKNQIRQIWANHRKNGRTGKPDVVELTNKHKSNQIALSKVEVKINRAMSPFADGVEKGGYYLKGLTESQKADVKVLSEDFRHTKNIRIRNSISGWDGLSAILTLIAVCNAISAYQSISNEPKRVSFASFGRDLSLAIGAVFGFMQGVVVSRDKKAYKVVEHATSKLIYGASLGRWTTILGGSAYAFSFVGGSVKLAQASAKLLDSVKKGEMSSMIKHGTDTLAEFSMALVNGGGLLRSAQVGWAVLHTEKSARAAIWASNSGRLLSIGLRVNLIGLLVSAAQLGVSVWYNRTSLSDYMYWFRHSEWGDEPNNQSLENNSEQLAKLTSKPKAKINKSLRGNALSLVMPAITYNELDAAGVDISVYWLVDHQRNEWQVWTESVGQQWVVISDMNEPLEIGLPLFQRELNAQHGIAIEVHYFPSAGSIEKATVRYQTTSLNKEGLLQEVSMLKVRDQSSDDFMPLTTNQLIQQDF